MYVSNEKLECMYVYIHLVCTVYGGSYPHSYWECYLSELEKLQIKMNYYNLLVTLIQVKCGISNWLQNTSYNSVVKDKKKQQQQNRVITQK